MKKKIVVLTGAGISAESGIPTFRDSNGLWNNHKIEDVATPMAWLKNPELVLEFYNERRKAVLAAQPNDAHIKLAELEKDFDVCIVTQNIDNLHERAGSTAIIHLHGEILKSRSKKYPELVYDCVGDIHIGDLCENGSQLRPHVIWFGESIPLIGNAEWVIEECDYFVIIGTSMQVQPAAGLFKFVPHYSRIIVIDPAIPDVVNFEGPVTFIKKNATEGINDLIDILKS